MEKISCREFFGKKVYIFEDHATAYYVWAKLSAAANVKPYLITLDHHTDTLPAFTRAAYDKFSNDWEKVRAYEIQLLNQINISDEQSIIEATDSLRHDEHIDAAIKSGVISHSFSLQLSDSSGTSSNEVKAYMEIDCIERLYSDVKYPEEPYTYSLPENKMFIVPPYKSITDQDLLNNKNSVLEDFYLEKQFRIIDSVMLSLGTNRKDKPYILDIDLDYFQTVQSVYPTKPNLFYELVRGAEYITIAKESVCVDMLKVDGEDIDSEFLLEKILGQINCACSAAVNT
ncbi:UPF0489 family protein [Vibrio metschnikovii]|uniref:UPF0489 family protein n=1 Tax=Vibrio metschnikovii TaxID=28172 RepID=UPI001C2F2170|nr:UPF0489 family protein [Vibrio metschnikovii]